MLSIVRNLLKDIIDNIDSGNSNITEEEQRNIIEVLSNIQENRISKYQACQYLNISRAKFDNLVKEGKLPEGRHQAGFKEKYWKKSEILKYITKDK